MLRSLKRCCPGAHTHVLCMDEETRYILEKLALKDVICLSLAEVEDEKLLAVKSQRTRAEYCWTLSPCLPWFVLLHNQHINSITYLDADLFFYSSLQPLFDEIKEASIVAIEHRFPSALEHLKINGRFCVEWVSFRRDEQGIACLSRWREQCIDWCFHKLEENRMGDQKYLDEWPEKYNNLHILQNIGAGVAPWNYSQYLFGHDSNDSITVDGELLIFYHFHQFQLLTDGTFDRLSDTYKAISAEPESIYKIYEKEHIDILEMLWLLRPGFSAGIKPVLIIKSQRFVQYILPHWLKKVLKKFIKAV